jgi:pyridoxamine 5'-phosphate oxidase family protein
MKSAMASPLTIGVQSAPHVVPVGWSFDAHEDTIEIGGFDLERTKKYRDVSRTGRAAVVIDDIASLDPWRGPRRRGPRPRRGRASARRWREKRRCSP